MASRMVTAGPFTLRTVMAFEIIMTSPPMFVME
jgi:hypothetical protein